MEFGPRALGCRSILGDPRSPRMQAQMNLKIKFREGFRPFAPSVLREHVSDYFELDCDSPYMLLVAPVKKERQIPHARRREEALGHRAAQRRCAPTSRPSRTSTTRRASRRSAARPTRTTTISSARSGELTGCPVVVNTSFNVRGEPIVCTPEDAYRCFMRTHIDSLVLGPFLLEKASQGEWKEDESWQREFQLD